MFSDGCGANAGSHLSTPERVGVPHCHQETSGPPEHDMKGWGAWFQNLGFRGFRVQGAGFRVSIDYKTSMIPDEGPLR